LVPGRGVEPETGNQDDIHGPRLAQATDIAARRDPLRSRNQRRSRCASRLRSGLLCPVWVDEGATIGQRLAVPDRRIPSMFRRSALTAAASLAVVLLAVTGCKVQVSAAGPGGGSTAGGASTAGAVQAGASGVTR